jgi:hypothetical protein
MHVIDAMLGTLLFEEFGARSLFVPVGQLNGGFPFVPQT